MTEVSEGVVSHYTAATNLAEVILSAAASAGITDLTPESLAPVDEFHTGGIVSSRELAAMARLQPGERVVDLGCAIGGPSRLLAAEFGCEVEGIDLTPELVEAARVLTERCGLQDKCRFQVGDATALPFETGTFDVAWTQHVVMNV